MTHKAVVSKQTLEFLKNLDNNNDREWFEANRPRFESQQAETKAFFEAVGKRVEQHDEVGKPKVFRIYRDVRFSKEKRPYKIRFGASFLRLGPHLRRGYYVPMQ